MPWLDYSKMTKLLFTLSFVTWQAAGIHPLYKTYTLPSFGNHIHPGVEFLHMGIALRGGGRFGIIDDDSGDTGPYVLELRRCNSSKSLNSRLRSAAQDGNLTAVQDLVAQGARVNALERTTHACALITASFQNDRDLANLLLRLGAKTDVQDEMMMTPLHYAAGWGYEEMTEILLGAGADPYIGNMVCTLLYAFMVLLFFSNFYVLKENLTAKELANNRGHVSCAELLQRWMDSR
jgi:hypothetical protein